MVSDCDTVGRVRFVSSHPFQLDFYVKDIIRF